VGGQRSLLKIALTVLVQVSYVFQVQPIRLVVSVGANPTSSWWTGGWMEALKGLP
jgi:hypothetical protein